MLGALGTRIALVAVGGILLAAAGIAVVPADAAEKKQPPACAAISFRPVASTLPDGDHDAGLYKSRYGKIELKATVKAGAASYYMLVNGQKPDAIAGGVPKGTESCLKSKHVAVPVKSQGANACTGTRFRVVIDRSPSRKVAMLFGLHGNDWMFCSAANV